MRVWVVALLAALSASALTAASAPGWARDKSHRRGYVIEFRSRPGDYFGHAYVVVGRQTGSGRIRATRKAGFMPDPGASEIEALGRVKGRVAFTAEDRRTPADERYRVSVSKAAHDRAVARIDGNKRRQPSFGLFDQNCNTFVGKIAEAAHLDTPDNDVTLPRDYVRELRARNARTATAD